MMDHFKKKVWSRPWPLLGLACILILSLIICASNHRAQAQDERGPADIVRVYYDKVLQALDQDKVNQEKLRLRLQELAGQVFNYDIMARMSLGKEWRNLNSDQQQRFVRLFTELLERTYFRKIQKHLDTATSYTDEDMQVTDEIIFSARKAEVKSEIAYEDTKVPVDYRFVKLDGAWKIYDVLVEKVSLVQNYRTQFTDILRDHSSEQFMQTLQDRVAEQRIQEHNATAAQPTEDS